jgi:hypothetical protein
MSLLLLNTLAVIRTAGHTVEVRLRNNEAYIEVGWIGTTGVLYDHLPLGYPGDEDRLAYELLDQFVAGHRRRLDRRS